MVQIDGLVVLKIIKHFEQAGGLSASSAVQGVLLGLLEGDTLEITNCFPFPTDDDTEFDAGAYQRDMIKKMRKINIDQLSVGWYQSSTYGHFITRELIDDQYGYQSSVEESVCLIYDSIRTINGSIGLRAYKMKPKFMKIYNETDVSNELFQKYRITYEDVLEELPIKYHNSHLIDCLLTEVGDKYPLQRNEHLLKLGVGSGLEKSLRLLAEHVDRMSSESARHVTYYKTVMKQQQLRAQHQQKKEQENLLREKRGEPPLPQEDLDKLYKMPVAPSRIDNVLLSAQVSSFCRDMHDSCGQSFSKLFVAEAIHTTDDSYN
jgi:translation initiation factor 3 subunit H